MSAVPHLYSVALFDILGFEARFAAYGLEAMATKYEQLISSVVRRNQRMSELEKMLGMEDEATWTAEGDAFVCNRIYGAYASDTILIWAHAPFPEARELSDQERSARASDPAHGWGYLPIPCDRFLEACSDVVCEALELDLPVRGAIAMGRAILDSGRGIFLGQPIIDAARMEKNQNLIGASLCQSYLSQPIPGLYVIPLDCHVKDSTVGDFSGLALNWPRRWRVTRKAERWQVQATERAAFSSTVMRLPTGNASSSALPPLGCVSVRSGENRSYSGVATPGLVQSARLASHSVRQTTPQR